MKIGPWDCHAVLTGHLKLDGGGMFGVVPKTFWNQNYPADKQNRITMVTRSLLLQSDNSIILVDTGSGNRWNEKLKNIYGINGDELIDQSLNELNLTPEDIDIVIHSHLHFDHCGGSLILKNGKLQPRFPNAKYIVHKKQYEWAVNPSLRDKASFRQEDFSPLKDSGKLELVDDNYSLPHIKFFVANGHTPGQLLPYVFDNKKSLLFAGDLIPLADQIKIPWIMAYDLNPLQTIKEKESILATICDGKSFLFFTHDEKIEIAEIAKDEKKITIMRTSCLSDEK